MSLSKGIIELSWAVKLLLLCGHAQNNGGNVKRRGMVSMLSTMMAEGAMS